MSSPEPTDFRTSLENAVREAVTTYADREILRHDTLRDRLNDVEKLKEECDRAIGQFTANQAAIKELLAPVINRREKLSSDVRTLTQSWDTEKAEALVQSVQSKFQALVEPCLGALAYTYAASGTTAYTEDMLQGRADQTINVATEGSDSTGLATPRTSTPEPELELVRVPRLNGNDGIPRRTVATSDPYEVSSDSDSDNDDIPAVPPRKRKRSSLVEGRRTLRTKSKADVQGRDFVFQHRGFGNTWLVVICEVAMRSKHEYHFANHPFEGGRAKKHFNGGAKATKCHDTPMRYEDEVDLICHHGYEVRGADAEWARRNNDSLVKSPVATATAASRRNEADTTSTPSRSTMLGPARRHGPAPTAEMDDLELIVSDI